MQKQKIYKSQQLGLNFSILHLENGQRYIVQILRTPMHRYMVLLLFVMRRAKKQRRANENSSNMTGLGTWHINTNKNWKV